MVKCLVVTGGSQGIGEQTIDLFHQDGWNVINISRKNNPRPYVTNINIDLADENWRDEFTPQLIAAVQGAEQVCLVHNAAIYSKDTLPTLTEDVLRSVLNINLISAVTLNHILLPYMPQGSSIIYIGSTLSEIAIPGRASYIISKHAVIGLMRVTCQDLATQGIHTCCICPGLVNTKMITEGADQQALQQFVDTKVIAKRLLEPKEIAEFIHFSARHPMVNGSIFHANLGHVMD